MSGLIGFLSIVICRSRRYVSGGGIVGVTGGGGGASGRTYSRTSSFQGKPGCTSKPTRSFANFNASIYLLGSAHQSDNYIWIIECPRELRAIEPLAPSEAHLYSPPHDLSRSLNDIRESNDSSEMRMRRRSSPHGRRPPRAIGLPFRYKLGLWTHHLDDSCYVSSSGRCFSGSSPWRFVPTL